MELLPVINLAAARRNLRPGMDKWTVGRWKEYMDKCGIITFNMLDDHTLAQLHYGRAFLAQYGKEKLDAVRKLETEVKIEPVKTGRVERDITDKKVFDENYEEPTDEQIEAIVDNIKEEPKPEEVVESEAPLPPRQELKRQLAEKVLRVAGAEALTPEVLAQHSENVEKIREAAGDPMKQKWAVAESLARKTESEVKAYIAGDGQERLDYHFLAMVHWCKRWIQETGSVPHYPNDLTEIFWPVPRALDHSEQAVQRRDAMVERVLKFIWKAVGERGTMMNRTTNSYRRTLAAQRLTNALESYAAGYRTPEGEPNKVPDEQLVANIKKATADYIESFFQITLEGVKPGPIDTLDPDYATYRMLCQKFNLQVGTLLHKAEL